MSIKRINSLSEFKNGIVKECNVFFSSHYADLMKSEGKEFYYVASEDYIMPIVCLKKGPFKSAQFPTEPYCCSSRPASCKAYLDAVCSFLKNEEHIQWISQNSPASLFSDYPTGSKHIPFGSHVVDLSLTQDDLWRNVHSKHRNVIKKAEKDGVVVVKGVTDVIVSDYHSIDLETWARSDKKASSITALKRQIQKLGDRVVVYMAYKDGEPQSGAILYYNKEMCYYMHGANKNNPYTGSGNLLQWRAMLDMKENGVKKYSFVGCRINEDENSKFHGIQRFKERFGGELHHCYLFKLDFNPLAHKLFSSLLCIKDLLIGSHKVQVPKDIIDQEIGKWSQSE